jgi:excisionase family DNA binding protein
VSDRLLTARELAERLGVDTETVLRWTRRGELPAIRLPGTKRGRLRYRESDYEAWLVAHETATPARGALTTPSDAAGGRLPFAALTTPSRSPATTTEEEPSDATR